MENDKTKRKVLKNPTNDELGQMLYELIYRVGGKYNAGIEQFKLLTSNPKFNVNWINDNNRTVLQYAATEGYFDVIEMLLRKKDISINRHAYGAPSALIMAVKRLSFRCAELLVKDMRTDVNLVDCDGKSALW